MQRASFLGLLGLFFLSSTAFGFEALPSKAPEPADNPSTSEKIALGKKLFFDKRLSKTNNISCNSCHNATGSGTDNQPVSTGIHNQKGGRNSPTVLNSAFWSVQFWDGRAATLEDQAKGPITNPVEMGMENHDAVIKKLAAIPEYQAEFKKVFGEKGMNIDNLARAIAAYERTLITPDSAFDLFIKGNKRAMSPSAQRGWKLVQSAGCTSCHSGAHFNGPPMPTGQGFYQKFPLIPGSDYDRKYELSKDLGRYEGSKQDADRNLWRVPSWRNVALTGPYFHNGKVKTLDEAVRVMAKTQLNRTLKPTEIADIVAFLRSLTGKKPGTI